MQQCPGVNSAVPDNQAYNTLLRSTRCLGERGFALLTGRWRALQRVTISPRCIGELAQAALVLTRIENISATYFFLGSPQWMLSQREMRHNAFRDFFEMRRKALRDFFPTVRDFLCAVATA
jgi:hypothetical protein